MVGLAREVFRLLGADPGRVLPMSSAALGRAASAAAGHSVLGRERWVQAGLPCLDHWREELGRAFPALAAAETGKDHGQADAAQTSPS